MSVRPGKLPSSLTISISPGKFKLYYQSRSTNITYRSRDRRSFRFLGVRYGNYSKRWTYSEVYEGNGERAAALNYPPICLQGPGGSEDCLFLNIWTPYLPRPSTASQADLLPVMFWLHGGEYRVGSGNDPTFDGGNLASRGDLVVVTVNYRLGTLGFLALDDGETNGNYGLGDQFTALEWVRRNIQDFGGDPDRITIFGQSSGASSGRVMLSSPKSLGQFFGVIMQSNPGGLADGMSYSKYYTIAEEMKEFGDAVLNATNCMDAPSQIECLRSLPTSTITNVTDIARYLVIDGDYIQSPELNLFHPNRTSIANVPLMIGMTRDDAAVALSVPSENETIHDVLSRFALPTSVAPSPEFPVPMTANHSLDLFNTTVRISTDGTMRCLNEATAYAGFKKGVFSTIFMYDFNRTYQMPEYSPNPPLCDAPITATFPHGDPSQEYFKCHQGELYYVFGNIQRQGQPLRDEFDLPFEQYVLDSWASFAHTGNPNPDLNMLKARGYSHTAQQVESTEAWQPFRRDDYRIRLMQWPSRMMPLNEVEQCRLLNISLNYYDQ